MSCLKKIGEYYRFTALTVFNIGVLFVFSNAGVLLFDKVVSRARDGNPVVARYGADALRAVYPDLNEEALGDLLHETWSRQYEYEPFTQFRERPYSGDYVNVDANGFRHVKNQGSWPPDSSVFSVFVFGGSTTFGYGVPDDQTIASYLQEQLADRLDREVCVYNFGRGHYYSTQERLLFERLLTAGFIPDAAVFIDGLNDFYYYDDVPKFTKQLGRFVPGRGRYHALEVLQRLPIMKLVPKSKEPNNVEQSAEDRIRTVAERYLRNTKLTEAVASAFDVQPIFVWQPAPTYKYDETHHPFAGKGYGRHSYSRAGYAYMAQRIEEEPPSDYFLWAADIQEQLQEPLYVDQLHYSGRMSKLLAQTIADRAIERGWLTAGSE